MILIQLDNIFTDASIQMFTGAAKRADFGVRRPGKARRRFGLRYISGIANEATRSAVACGARRAKALPGQRTPNRAPEIKRNFLECGGLASLWPKVRQWGLLKKTGAFPGLDGVPF